MRSPLALLLCLALPLTSQARWEVKSEFQLHLTEPLFDKLIEDFWQSLQGTQNVPAGNVSFDAGNRTSVLINGINVKVNYAFPVPKRVSPTVREWELASNNIGARVTADQMLVTQIQTQEIGGIIFENVVTVECRNIALVLPQGAASIKARVRAEVAQNQVQLTMPSYNAQWGETAWQVEALNCPTLANIQGTIKEQIVKYLSSFENLDQEVGIAIREKFATWSKDASLLLLSQLELPTKSDYLKVYYEPKEAKENNGKGLVLSGTLRFDYPYVAQGQEFTQEFKLPAGTTVTDQASPQLLIPFKTIQAMMMGEYFAGKLEYTTRSSELPAFNALMQSRFKQWIGWPDLLTYDKETTFLFQFLPLGPPSFDNAKAGASGSINGDLNLPLSVRMFAPLSGKWTPYVEFRTLLAGNANMTLQKDGKVNFKIDATEQPATYAFAQKYIQQYNPSTKIAISTIAAASRDSLSGEGMQMSLPTFTVGKQLQLVPQGWNLQGNQVLKLDFTAASTATAAVASTTVKTSTNKTLTVTSSSSKKR